MILVFYKLNSAIERGTKPDALGWKPCYWTSTFEFISIQSLAAKGEDEPGMMEGTADVPHPRAAAHLSEAASVCDAATALDTALDMVGPQPPLVELLVRHVLLPREVLPQIEINSSL
jgi:hypothetical protein